jgi:hypothetical protein
MAKKIIAIVASVFLISDRRWIGCRRRSDNGDHWLRRLDRIRITHLSTRTAALVTTIDNINESSSFATSVKKPTLQITMANPSQEVFVGVGPRADVEQYLGGVAIENVKDLDLYPFRLTTEQRAGDARPAAPADQSFWIARGSGREATLTWPLSDGSYVVVVMNADASPSVAVDGQIALTVPHLFAIGIGVLVGGIVLTVAGVILLIVGIRIRTGPGPTAAGAAAGAPGGP